MDLGEKGVTQVVRLVACGDIVGESAVWCDRRQRLFWVDIVGRRIGSYSPDRDEVDHRATPDLVTSIGLRGDGGAIVGLRKDVMLWDFRDSFTHLATVEPDILDNRLNEGRVGPDGAFWVGTMQDNIAGDGSPVPMDRASGGYYRVQADGRIEPLTAREYGICNTMAWTADGRFLCADTLADQLYVFDHEADGLHRRRRFGTPLGRGLPDGSALDRDGFLWNCRVGGGAVTRFAPDGSLDRLIELPCSAPTSCTFGGSNLDTLFVTSARFGLSDQQRANPDEGALYALEPGVSGLPEHRFG